MVKRREVIVSGECYCMNATIVKKVSDMWTHLSVVSKAPLPLSEVCVFAVLYFFLRASCEREGGGEVFL